MYYSVELNKAFPAVSMPKKMLSGHTESRWKQHFLYIRSEVSKKKTEKASASFKVLLARLSKRSFD